MIYDSDPYLAPYRERIDRRYRSIVFQKQETAGYGRRLCDAVNNHLYYGVHLENDSVVFREWAPNATAVYLIGEMNGWRGYSRPRYGSLRESTAGSTDLCLITAILLSTRLMSV